MRRQPVVVVHRSHLNNSGINHLLETFARREDDPQELDCKGLLSYTEARKNLIE